jgi:hypothetical protein
MIDRSSFSQNRIKALYEPFAASGHAASHRFPGIVWQPDWDFMFGGRIYENPRNLNCLKACLMSYGHQGNLRQLVLAHVPFPRSFGCRFPPLDSWWKTSAY